MRNFFEVEDDKQNGREWNHYLMNVKNTLCYTSETGKNRYNAGIQ